MQALKLLPASWESVDGQYVRLKKNNPKDFLLDLAELKAWGLKYNVNLQTAGSIPFYDGRFDGQIWNLFKFVEGGVEDTRKIQDQAQGFKVCRACYQVGLAIDNVARLGGDGKTSVLCANCVQKCSKCENTIPKAEAVSYKRDLCFKCAPTFKCYSCAKLQDKEHAHQGTLHNSAGKVVATNKDICKTCADNVCTECNKLYTRQTALRVTNGEKVCQTCLEERMLRDFAKHEKFRLEELPKGGMTIESLPARPFRTVSIETEVDGDRYSLAKTLYKNGIVRVPEVERYGEHTPDNSSWPAFLKHDGSVTGGELISFMLELNKRQHADALKTTLRKLRALEACDVIQFNPNCGGHIHIDATGFSQANVWRLLTIWNYIEDFTFRLAGSGHKYGHRTLVPGHDRANGGVGYSNPTVKGPWGLKSAATQAFGGQGRMCGLNFQPYLSAIRYCQCGARDKDNWINCKCDLPKCTIEWRVWNSQRNPRILHAWIAYMQAMHALADDKEPDVDWEKKHATLAWNKVAYVNTSDSHKRLLRERIEWVFANFILTDYERDSLIYAIKNSDIPVTPADERQWLSIKGPSSTYPVRKAPRVMTSAPRNRRIVCTIPDPNVPIKSTRSMSYSQLRQQAANAAGIWR